MAKYRDPLYETLQFRVRVEAEKRRREETKGARTPTRSATILEVMDDPDLFGPWFQGASWDAWRAFLAGVFGLPMTPAQRDIWRGCTNRELSPTRQATEAWMVVGRRGGKSRISALIAVYLACFRNYAPYLSPGEVATIPVIAARRDEARTVMGYVKAYLEVPKLAARVRTNLAESITLNNNVRIETHTGSFKSVRGYTVVAALCDEIAFWETSSDSANPDSEVIKALRPGMASIPNALLVGLSSPYARKGVLWEVYDAHFGKDDPEVVWQADTRTMNPSIPQSFIDREYEKDESSAAAEYGAQFRRDVEVFVTIEAVDAVVQKGRFAVPPQRGVKYTAFVDPSGGSSDSMTLSIAYQVGASAVQALIRERRAPFNPADVVKEFAGILDEYGIETVIGDRYGGVWPSERFAEHGIYYRTAELTKSEYYLELLSATNSKRVELLDEKRQRAQYLALERRTSRGGRDSVDHPPGGHDDVINAGAGALVEVMHRPEWTVDVAAALEETVREQRDQQTRAGSMRAQVERAMPNAFVPPPTLTCGQCYHAMRRANGSMSCLARRLIVQDKQPACSMFEVGR